MHNFLAGLVGFFASFFHGGQAMPSNTIHTQTVQQALSGTPLPTGKMRQGRIMMRIPTGDKLFFGTVTTNTGSTLTVQMQMPHRFTSPSITPQTSQTVTVNLTSSTKYSNGSQTSITTNTRIAGYGTANSDGSITAVQIRINPVMRKGNFKEQNNNGNTDGTSQ